MLEALIQCTSEHNDLKACALEHFSDLVAFYHATNSVGATEGRLAYACAFVLFFGPGR
jgi:hypothetical protein